MTGKLSPYKLKKKKKQKPWIKDEIFGERATTKY